MTSSKDPKTIAAQLNSNQIQAGSPGKISPITHGGSSYPIEHAATAITKAKITFMMTPAEIQHLIQQMLEP